MMVHKAKMMISCGKWMSPAQVKPSVSYMLLPRNQPRNPRVPAQKMAAKVAPTLVQGSGLSMPVSRDRAESS